MSSNASRQAATAAKSLCRRTFAAPFLLGASGLAITTLLNPTPAQGVCVDANNGAIDGGADDITCTGTTQGFNMVAGRDTITLDNTDNINAGGDTTPAGTLRGGADQDLFIFSDNSTVATTVYGGNGISHTTDSIGGEDIDTFIISGDAVISRIEGESGGDVFNQSGGTVSILQGGNNDEDAITIIDGGDLFTMSGGQVTGIRADDGDDTVTMTNGLIIDRIRGDAGNDVISISGGTIQGQLTLPGDTTEVLGVTIYGGAGDDIVTISNVADIEGSIRTQSGDDTILLQGGTTGAIFAGEDADSIVFSGTTVLGDVFADTGADYIEIQSGSLQSNNVRGQEDNDTIRMTGGTLTGSIQGDGVYVSGNPGGNNEIGDDSIALSGTAVVERNVFAGPGQDTITIGGSAQVDRLFTGVGSSDNFETTDTDFIFLNAGTVHSRIDGDDGIDNIALNGGVLGGTGPGNIFAHGGDDFIRINNNAVVNGTIDGEAGNDDIQVTGADAFVNSIVGGDEAASTVAATCTNPTAGDCIQVFGGTVNTIDGGAGNDLLRVRSAGTVGSLTGGDGEDNIRVREDGVITTELRGGADNDIIDLVGGTTEAVFGDGGADRIRVDETLAGIGGTRINGNIDAGAGNDVINLVEGTVGGLVTGNSGDDDINLSGSIISSGVQGGTGSDTITMTSGSALNIFTGTSGATETDQDTVIMSGGTVNGIFGDDGADVFEVTGGNLAGIRGDGGNDVVTYSGATASVDIETNDGNDVVTLTSGSIQGSILTGIDDDILNLNGGFIGDGIAGGSGGDNVIMVDGDDTVNVGTGFALSNITEVGSAAKIGGGLGVDQINFTSGANQNRSIGESEIIGFEIINFDGDSSSMVTIQGGAAAFGLDTGGGAGTEINVNSGTLHLSDATSDIRAETVTFAEGTVLSGVGTITSSETFIGGAHTVGLSPGTQNIIGDTTYTSTASVIAEFDDSNAGAFDNNDIDLSQRGIEFDAINITGNLTIDPGATLNIAFIEELAFEMLTANPTGLQDGDQFDIFNVSGTITGNFVLVTDGAANVADFNLAWRTYSIAGEYGIELVTITSIPEPAAALLVTGGIFGAIRLRRMQKQKPRSHPTTQA